MAIVVAGIIAGVVIGAVSHDDYSDYYSNHSDYSDYAERERRRKEEIKRNINSKKKELEGYVNNEVNSFKNQYNIKGNVNTWRVENASFNNSKSDFTSLENNLKSAVDRKIQNELKEKIGEDEKDIKEIDELIAKINKIQLRGR